MWGAITLNHDDKFSPQDYWRVIRKRKWSVILTTLVSTGAAVIFSFLQTPIYEAPTTLYLKELRDNPGQIDVFGGTSFLSTEVEINTQIEIIRSRTVTEEVARRLSGSFVIPPEGPGEMDALLIREEGKSLSEIAERLRNNNLSVSHIPNTRLITITASHNDPGTAQLIANTVAEVFIERDINSRRRETTAALDFLSNELTKVEENLEQVEENLRVYKEKEGFAELSSQATLIVERLSILESEYESTRISRQELIVRLNEIKGQFDNVSKVWVSSTYISDNPVVQMLRTRLTDLEIKYAQLSREFSSDDPQLSHVEVQIEETKKELKSKVETVVAGKTETINPIYTELYSKIVNYESEVNALEAKEDALATLVVRYENEVNRLPQQELTLARLEREKRVNTELYGGLVNAKNEAEIASMSTISMIEVIDPAPRPTRPVRPRKEVNALMGSLFGLMLGIFLGFVLERSDKTVKTENEVKQLLNLPIIGVIPRADVQPKSSARYRYRGTERQKREEIETPTARANSVPIELISRDIPESPASEAYRVLATNLQFTEIERKLKTLVVTSSVPLEGKTSVAINLAITLASARNRVLLVDVDLRSPTIHRIFNLDIAPGLTDVLMGLDSPAWTVHGIEEVDNFDLLTSGSSAPNPSELLRSSRMKELIVELQKNYDRVVFDCPPVLGLADVPILSTNVDGVLLVVGANEVDREAIQKAKESLEKVRAPIVGVILNKVGPEQSVYGRYYYHYYSGKSERDET